MTNVTNTVVVTVNQNLDTCTYNVFMDGDYLGTMDLTAERVATLEMKGYKLVNETNCSDFIIEDTNNETKVSCAWHMDVIVTFEGESGNIRNRKDYSLQEAKKLRDELNEAIVEFERTSSNFIDFARESETK